MMSGGSPLGQRKEKESYGEFHLFNPGVRQDLPWMSAAQELRPTTELLSLGLFYILLQSRSFLNTRSTTCDATVWLLVQIGIW